MWLRFDVFSGDRHYCLGSNGAPKKSLNGFNKHLIYKHIFNRSDVRTGH